MTGPGDIGYGPALDAIQRDLEGIKRVLEALCKRSLEHISIMDLVETGIVQRVADGGFDKAMEELREHEISRLTR